MNQNNYPVYYQTPTQQYTMGQQRQQQPAYILKGRPVSSLDEARAANIDFDGSISFFPDIANEKIYTKQINMDGTASLKMYELKEIPNTDPNYSSYVTREEFDNTLADLKQTLENFMASQKQTPPPVVTQPKEETKPQVLF